jgi:hypothetical protein
VLVLRAAGYAFVSMAEAVDALQSVV